MYVRITNTGQLLDLQRRLRAAGNENLRRSMQRRIRRAAEPLRDDLKSAVRHNPIRGQGSTSPGGRSPTTRPLRAAVANSIRISVRTTGGGAGARIWIDRSALPADFKNAPEKINDGKWRHPTFGRRPWVQMHSKTFWAPTVQKHGPRMLAEVRRCLDDVKNKLS